LFDIGINPLRIYKSGFMKYRFVERTFLKRTTNEGCRPKNCLLQMASHELCFYEDRRREADKKIIFLLKPAVLPPCAAKGNLVKSGFPEFAAGKSRKTE
jgi:hypothetical protein